MAAVADLIELTGTDAVDLAHLNRGGPVLRERALVGSVALFESEPLTRIRPDTYHESFLLAARAGLIDEKLAAALAPAAGLRNVLVHAYLDVDHERVAEATVLAPDVFGEYVRQASHRFAERSGS